MAALNWEKRNRTKLAYDHGTKYAHAARHIPANDPIRIEERRRRREREPEIAARAAELDAKLKPLGIDKDTYKRINREYKALRIAGKLTQSYNDWMRERLRPADQSGL